MAYRADFLLTKTNAIVNNRYIKAISFLKQVNASPCQGPICSKSSHKKRNHCQARLNLFFVVVVLLLQQVIITVRQGFSEIFQDQEILWFLHFGLTVESPEKQYDKRKDHSIQSDRYGFNSRLNYFNSRWP